MKITQQKLGGCFFFFISYLKSLAFLALQTATLPMQLLFTVSRPDFKRLGYEDLLRQRERHPSKAKLIPDVSQYQANYARRVANIAHFFEAKRILEVGCGKGTAASVLQKKGFEVSAVDVVDVLDRSIQQSGVNFLRNDVCQGLSFPDEVFDMAFSVNSFEHLINPAAALDEILRVIRPGGVFYLCFDPLYYSPWGLHAARRLGFPYPQILFTETTIQRFVDEESNAIAQTYDPTSDKTHIGPALNHWTVEQFRQIFQGKRESLKVFLYNESTTIEGLGMVAARPGLFKAYAPSFKNLIISGISLLARKI